MTERLDVALAAQTGLTRSRVGALIRQGCARVDGATRDKPGFAVLPGQTLELDVPPAAPARAEAEDIPLNILYEDDALAVVNKPCGMVVHPAAGNERGTLVNALLFRLDGLSGIGGEARPGIVHRLDKDTSGLLLVAKNDRAHAALSDMLKAHEIQKTYAAVALGAFRDERGTIEAPIGRDPRERKRMAVVPDGRYARTEYAVRERLRGATLLDVTLVTGRTHQIRVHMTHIGHPLLGDPVYGGRQNRDAAPRLMLHAFRLSLRHPITGAPLSFEAPIPPAFAQTVDRLR